MPKLYCISDIHGFYTEMRKALDEAGFDPNNEDHWLIVCGDVFDRGDQPAEVMRYLRNLPRKVLIKGNHESLVEECGARGDACSHDYSNGTYGTICELGGAGEGRSFDECCIIAEQRVKPFFNMFVDYFETKNHIFVHSFVPLKCDDNLPMYYIRNRKFKVDPDWRNAHHSAWEQARWGNPYELAEQGLLPDKTLVFGHFHTSWPRHKYEGQPEWGEGADFNTYYGDGYIALDGCTAYSGKVNVLVLEDEFLTE